MTLKATLPALLLLLSAAAHAAAKPDPPIQIPLEPLGFPAPVARLAALGATLYTLNFVDDKHLLLTYYTRGLLTRMPDADASDNDANVAAILLELPTGKVLGRTEWRVRDRDTFLWPLGHGRFLFRVRSRLTTLDPMGNLAAGDPFKQELLGDMKRRIGYITTSPGGELLVIETVPPLKPRASAGQAAVAFEEEHTKRPDVEVYFYRMRFEKGTLVRVSAGALAADNLIGIPADADGFVTSVRESPNVFDFDYHSHAGAKLELSPFDTSCTPHVHWVSRAEFVALGCHGTPDKPELGGFNLKGENAWIEVLPGNQLSPSFLASPQAGRFALSRILIKPDALNTENLLPEEITGQEISVRQNYDGHLLQKLTVSPVQRAGQNFDLSPDGLSLATIRDGVIEVYRLPNLTSKDQAELKRAQAMEPPRNDARIRLNSVPIDTPAAASAPQAAEVLPGALPEQAPPPGPERTNVVGDIPVEHRKPPSLYGPDYPKKPE